MTQADKEWVQHLEFHKTPNTNCHYCMANAE